MCMPLQLASAEEFEGDSFSGSLGEILIRWAGLCSNGRGLGTAVLQQLCPAVWQHNQSDVAGATMCCT